MVNEAFAGAHARAKFEFPFRRRLERDYPHVALFALHDALQNHLRGRFVLEHLELRFLGGGGALHLAEVFARLLDTHAQPLQLFFYRQKRFLETGLGLAGSRRLRLDCLQRFARRLRTRRERSLVGLEALGAHDGLALRRLAPRYFVAYLGGPAVALHRLRPRRLHPLAQFVDGRLRRLERLLSLLQRGARRFQRLAEKLRLLLQRLRLHPQFLNLAARPFDFAPVSLRERTVFRDALRIDSDDLVRSAEGALRRRLLLRYRLQPLLQRVYLGVEALAVRLRRFHRRDRLGYRRLHRFTVALVLFKRAVEVVDFELRQVDVHAAQLVAQILVALRLADLPL